MRKLYTLETVAKALSSNVSALHSAIKAKTLDATKVDGKLYIEAGEAVRFAGKPLALGAAEYADAGKADDRLACIPEQQAELMKLYAQLANRVTVLESQNAARSAPPSKTK